MIKRWGGPFVAAVVGVLLTVLALHVWQDHQNFHTVVTILQQAQKTQAAGS